MKAAHAFRPPSWLTATLIGLLVLLALAPLCAAAPRHPSRGLTIRAAAGSSREVLEFNRGIDIASPRVCPEIAAPSDGEWLPAASEAVQDSPLFSHAVHNRAPPAR